MPRRTSQDHQQKQLPTTIRQLDADQLEEALADFLSRPDQDSGRLDALAQFCRDAFAWFGLPGVRGGAADEVAIRGLARQKDWDLAFVHGGKPRLLVSLKSIMKRMSGSIPNRLDDLMGEAANVQQYSPELVIGYVCVLDEQASTKRREGGTWADYFEQAVRNIAVRKAPLWNPGVIEGAWIIRIDSAQPHGHRLISPSETMAAGHDFFQSLLKELFLREPAVRGLVTPRII